MENSEIIGKRINLDAKNIKRAKVISMLLETEVDGMNEKAKLDYVINKALENYYASDEIKELLDI